MSNTQVISNLWDEMREAINLAYKPSKYGDDLANLRDYSENASWSDDLQKLLDTATAEERQHRNGHPQVAGFSASTGAKLILMHNVITGSRKLPSPFDYLIFRHSAFEAEVIGYLIREYLPSEWINAVESFDYAKLMKGAA